MIKTITRSLLVPILVGIVLSGCAKKPQTLTPAEQQSAVLAQVLTQFLIPEHAAFAEQAALLVTEIDRFCQHKDEQTLSAARTQWRLTMAHKSRLNIVNYGPIDNENFAWKIQFWPDNMNLVGRKFKSRLEGPITQITTEALAKASVAIQGLSALEYLLFDSEVAGLVNERPQPCLMLKATAENLATNAKTLEKQWREEMSQQWLPAANTPVSAEANREHLARVFGGIISSLATIESKKLAPALDLQGPEHTPGHLNPMQLEAWRSLNSLANIQQTLKAIEQLYTMDHGFSWYLSSAHKEDSTALDKRIRTLLFTALLHIEDMKTPAFVMLQAGHTDKLVSLQRQVTLLRDTLQNEYSQATGLHYSFNANDGD